MKAIPYRHDFYNRLAQGGSHEIFDAELAKWLDALDVIVKRIKTFLEEGGYGRI